MDALLWLLVPVAACGAMMIGCVWLMRRGMPGRNQAADNRPETPDAEAGEVR